MRASAVFAFPTLAAYVVLSNPLLLAGEVRGRVVVTRGLTKKRVIVPQYEQRGAAVYEPPANAKVDEFQKIVVYLEGSQAQPGSPVTARIGKKIASLSRMSLWSRSAPP